MKKFIIKLFGRRPRKRNLDLSSIRSILLKPIGDAVGDAVVHIAHLNLLKKAFPKAKIGVIVTERNKAIFQHAGLVDRLIEDKRRNYFLQRGEWELYLDFMPGYTSRSLILDYVLNPGIVINFGKENKKYYNLATVHNYDFSTKIPDFTHIKDYLFFSALSPYLPKEEVYYSLPVPTDSTPIGWKKKNGVRILLNPQGSCRQLPPEELNELIRGIDKRFYSDIELLLTNVKGSGEYLTYLADSPVAVQLAPVTDILQYFNLICSADIIVAVDGGAVHIACAYGKPLLAFYANCPRLLHRWAPVPGKNVNVLTLLGRHESPDNNGTRGFELEKAVAWLNAQIEYEDLRINDQ